MQSLDNLGYLTTSQIQRLHDLGGRRNACRILNDMGELLCSFQLEEKVYYLSAAGRKEIGSTVVRRKTIQVTHSILRNEIYIRYKPDGWKAEFPIKWADKSVIPDAIFRQNGKFVLLEVDHTQTMAQNERKIAQYKELQESQVFQRKFGHFPRVMFVTISSYRQQALQTLLGEMGEALTFNDLK